MTAPFEAALGEGNFAGLHGLYSHGVLLHTPEGDVHGRDNAIAADLNLFREGGGAPFALRDKWGDRALHFSLGERLFAMEWRIHQGRVVEAWRSEMRGPKPIALAAARLLPPFEVVHRFGQFAPEAEYRGSIAGADLHRVWNRRDLTSLAHNPALRQQTLDLLHRFPCLTATVEAEFSNGEADLLRWRLQAPRAGAIVDLFLFSTWRSGLWEANFLDEAVLEEQLRQIAKSTLAEESF